jgi:hypothetical protein
MQFSFHPLHMSPKLSKFSFHSLQMCSKNLSQFSAHTLQMPGDNFSQLSFHLLQMRHRSSVPVLFLEALMPPMNLPANIHIYSALWPFFINLTPLCPHTFDPHLPILGHEGNPQFLPFSQPPSHPSKFLTLPGYKYGHMVVALEWLDDDTHIPSFIDLSLDQTYKRSAHCSNPVALLSPEYTAEYQRRKQHEHQSSAYLFHDSSPLN